MRTAKDINKVKVKLLFSAVQAAGVLSMVLTLFTHPYSFAKESAGGTKTKSAASLDSDVQPLVNLNSKEIGKANLNGESEDAEKTEAVAACTTCKNSQMADNNWNQPTQEQSAQSEPNRVLPEATGSGSPAATPGSGQ